MAQYATQLYDAMMVYAGVLNKTIASNQNIRDGAFLFNRTKDAYPGALANVIEACDGSRIPYFIVTGVGRSAEPKRLIAHTLIPLYDSQNEIQFASNGRPIPMTVPACGFTEVEKESRLRRELRKLKEAIPPLPSPAKLYDQIIEASTMIMITTEIFDQLKEDSSLFYMSNAPYGELERDTQIFELRTGNCKMRLEFLRRLRLLFSKVPVLIATKAMNENAWNARMERPQYYISRDGQRKPLLTDANLLELIINDHLRFIDEFYMTIQQTRAECLTRERAEREARDVRVFNAIQSIQQTMVEVKDTVSKQKITIKSCAAWTQTYPLERQKVCRAVQTTHQAPLKAKTMQTEAPSPPTLPQMPQMPAQPMLFP
ncbi:unnamed protein product [Cylicocyclus nassatus]|uniref:Uncharacterized protein n=1 Tax=Cylicocyclus nassatus TaxID=53992 RepID=A0AA36DKZ3_CYLNA|nr:unnamed protein product [Cylicocyclus nassatus]